MGKKVATDRIFYIADNAKRTADRHRLERWEESK